MQGSGASSPNVAFAGQGSHSGTNIRKTSEAVLLQNASEVVLDSGARTVENSSLNG